MDNSCKTQKDKVAIKVTMPKFKVEKKEAIFIGIGLAIILLWFLLIKDLVAPFLSTLFPLFAMLLYNLGFFVGFYFLSAPLNGHGIKWKIIISLCIGVVGISLLNAPYMVGKDGVINHNAEYWFVSADAGVGSFYSLFIPASATIFGVSWIWLLTYPFSISLILLFIPTIFLAPKQVAKMFGH